MIEKFQSLYENRFKLNENNTINIIYHKSNHFLEPIKSNHEQHLRPALTLDFDSNSAIELITGNHQDTEQNSSKTQHGTPLIPLFENGKNEQVKFFNSPANAFTTVSEFTQREASIGF